MPTYPSKDDLRRNPDLPASYGSGYDADEDGWKADARAEFRKLERLSEDVDQAASLARDCETLCPEAKKLLDLAWWFTEDAIREATGKCSTHTSGYCQCCAHYKELTQRASSIRGRL